MRRRLEQYAINSHRADATKVAACCAPESSRIIIDIGKSELFRNRAAISVCLLCLGLARNSSHSESEARGRAWRVSQPAATLPRPVPSRLAFDVIWRHCWPASQLLVSAGRSPGRPALSVGLGGRNDLLLETRPKPDQMTVVLFSG